MTLRVRLIAAFTVLLLVVIAVFGVVAIRSTRRLLISQIDERITIVMAQTARLRTDRRPLAIAADRVFAELLLDPDNKLVAASPSGLEGEPDPLPDLTTVPDLDIGKAGIVTVPSEDGTFSYRAGMVRTIRGSTVVFAQPLREVDAAIAALRQRLLVAGLWIMGLGAVAVWFTVRRGLRPVDDMITTATAIAGGDLTRRVPPAEPDSELGQLGSAINEMLASIESAFDSEARANQKLKQFVADASHELRTPLAAISGYTELHRKGALAGTDGTDQAMRRIEAESKRMRNLVEDLLLLARLDLAQTDQAQTLNKRLVEITALVRDAAADSMAIDPERLITVDAPDPVQLDGDAEGLIQIISNLLANVRAHTPPGIPATVTVRADGRWVVVTVTDQGAGFPPESLASVFNRFYRADESRSRKSGGSGLGLAIVEALVRAHGGLVTADNAPGGGAQLTVRLPQSMSQPTPRRSQVVSQVDPSGWSGRDAPSERKDPT